MHIQYQELPTLIENGIVQLNAFFDNGEWPETLAQGAIVADTNRDRSDRRYACFRIIEDIERIRGRATGPDDNEEAFKLAEHFREIRQRLLTI